jgi:hypothetical protein
VVLLLLLGGSSLYLGFLAVVFVLFVQSLFVKLGASSFGHIYLTFVLLTSVLGFSLVVLCHRDCFLCWHILFLIHS